MRIKYTLSVSNQKKVCSRVHAYQSNAWWRLSYTRRLLSNVTLLMNTASRSRLGNSYYNQLTVTPRYETKDVSMGLPLTYSTLSSRFKVGLGILTRGFFIGSDDLLSAFVKSEYGINLYAGLNVPIYK